MHCTHNTSFEAICVQSVFWVLYGPKPNVEAFICNFRRTSVQRHDPRGLTLRKDWAFIKKTYFYIDIEQK